MTRHPQIFQISIFMFIEPKLTFKIQKNDFGQKRLFKDIQLLKETPCWQRSSMCSYEVEVNGERTQTGNSEFVRQAVAWTFQEHGKLRARNAHHRLLDMSGPVNPNRYTVKEMVRYEVILEQYSLKYRIHFLFITRCNPYCNKYHKNQSSCKSESIIA